MLLMVLKCLFRRAPGMDGMRECQVATNVLCVRMGSIIYQGVKEDEAFRRALHSETHGCYKRALEVVERSKHRLRTAGTPVEHIIRYNKCRLHDVSSQLGFRGDILTS